MPGDKLEILYFTATAVALYLLSDWLLGRIEAYAGRTLEYRSVVFFAILLTLALATFALIRRLAGA